MIQLEEFHVSSASAVSQLTLSMERNESIQHLPLFPLQEISKSLFFSSSLSQVVTWLQGPGSELLKTHQEIGDSIRAAQALQQKHEEIESQHSVMQHAEHTHTHTCDHVTRTN